MMKMKIRSRSDNGQWIRFSRKYKLSIVNRPLLIVLCTIVLFLCPLPASAADLSQSSSTNSTDSSAPLPLPQINSPSAIIMDARTRAVIYEKNPRERRPMASTTKLMTILIALEYGDIGREVVVSPDAMYSEWGTTEIKLKPGDHVSSSGSLVLAQLYEDQQMIATGMPLK